MKRMLARLTVLLFACALTACGQTASLSDSAPVPPEQSGTFATEDSSAPGWAEEARWREVQRFDAATDMNACLAAGRPESLRTVQFFLTKLVTLVV